MADLIATSAFQALLPLEIGGITATEESFDAITSVAPLRGQTAAVSAAMEAQIGLALPAIGRMVQSDKASLAWAGHGQFFLFGVDPGPIPGAAQTDQTDAWACLLIDGLGARDVLARLTAIDLRPAAFEIGHAARAQLGHMNALIIRTCENSYRLMVFRSMAETLAHEIGQAMRSVAARAG